MKELMKKRNTKQKERGITLIALVVTIIVLLILAGVSIQMLTGQTGILKNAQQAREETTKGQIKEDVQRDIMEKMTEGKKGDITADELYEILDNYFEGVPLLGDDAWKAKDFPASFPQLHSKEGNYTFNLGDIYGGKLSGASTTREVDNTKPGKPYKDTGAFSENSTVDGKSGSYNNPTIPAGFKPVNDGSNWGDGTESPKEEEVNKGLVIEDEEQNQFVWVPVPTVVGQIDRGIEIDISTTPMAEEDGSNYKGILYSGWKFSENLSEYKVKASSSKEPVTLDDDSKYGITDDLQVEYNTMIGSVSTYGGFYVARYEMSLSSDTIKKAQYKKGATSATDEETSANSWYGFYAYNKEFATKYRKANSTIKSSMIWGSQYDAMMNWMARCGKDVTATIGDNRNKSSYTGTVETDKINNIYDLYGNRFEWTLQRSAPFYVAYRGGNFDDHLKHDYSPSYRTLTGTGGHFDDRGSRASLYL